MPPANIVNGWTVVGDQFPPSLNNVDDPSRLEVFESPYVHGANWTTDGFLASSTQAQIGTGTALDQTKKTLGGVVYYWYYGRLWGWSGTTLLIGEFGVDDIFLKQGTGKMVSEATIIGVQACFGNALWVMTATGSYILKNADDRSGVFELGQFLQDIQVKVLTAVPIASTMDGMPVWTNYYGTYIYDGSKVIQLSRKAKIQYSSSVGAFDSSGVGGIFIDYNRKKIDLRTSSTSEVTQGVIDMETGKLLSYLRKTTGDEPAFEYYTPVLMQEPSGAPFTVDTIALVIKWYGPGDTTINWATRAEEEDWFIENEIYIHRPGNEYTRIEKEINNPSRSAHKFQIAITGLESNIWIKTIMLNVTNYAPFSFAS